MYMFHVGAVFMSRPNCFQIVVQHFSEEQIIFYFAGETPEQAQVLHHFCIYITLKILKSCKIKNVVENRKYIFFLFEHVLKCHLSL